MTFYGIMINRKTSEIFAPFGGHQNHCLFLCAKLSKLTASPGWVGNRKPKSHRDLASTLCAQFHPRLFGLTRVATIDLGAEISPPSRLPVNIASAPSSGAEHLDSQSGPGRRRRRLLRPARHLHPTPGVRMTAERSNKLYGPAKIYIPPG